MYVCIHTYVYMYMYMGGWMDGHTCMCVCMYCMYGWKDVHVCMYVCMYVCVYVYVSYGMDGGVCVCVYMHLSMYLCIVMESMNGVFHPGSGSMYDGVQFQKVEQKSHQLFGSSLSAAKTDDSILVRLYIDF